MPDYDDSVMGARTRFRRAKPRYETPSARQDDSWDLSLAAVMDRLRRETVRGNVPDVVKARQEADAEAKALLADEYANAGASRLLVEVSQSDNPLARDTAGALLQVMGLGGNPEKFSPKNTVQVNELADRLFQEDRDGTSGFGQAIDLFGAATPDFIRFLTNTHSGMGGDSRSFDTFLEIASDMASETRSGAELARNLMAGYARFLPAAVVAGRDAKSGQAVTYAMDDIDPNRRLRLDAMLQKTVRAFRQHDQSVSKIFDDPAVLSTVQGVVEVADWLDDLGVSAEAEFKARGKSFSDQAGEYVFGTRTQTQTPGNLVRHLSEVQTAFTNIRPAQTEAEVTTGLSALHGGFQRGLMSAVKDGVFSGGSLRDVVKQMASGGRAAEMVSSVVGEIAKVFGGGKDGEAAAQIVAFDALEQFVQTGSVDFKSVVDHAAFYDEGLAGDEVARGGLRTLQAWARFNSSPLDEDKWGKVVAGHLADIGFAKPVAESMAATTLLDAARIATVGENGSFNYMAPILTMLNLNQVYEPIVDAKTKKQATHPITKLPMWRTAVKDVRTARGDKTEDEWVEYQTKAKNDVDNNAMAEQIAAAKAKAGKKDELTY